ncbi:MAG: glucose-6-phosphate isomerase [Bacteroidota bacterium]
MLQKIDPASSKFWGSLASLANNQNGSIKDLFNEPNRVKKLSFQDGDFLFDFSKNSVSSEVLAELLGLAKDCHLKEAIQAQFSGVHINETEDRAVLHTALRDLNTEGKNAEDVRAELKKIEIFSSQLLDGTWKGYSGKSIRDIVNVGIGGSDLGPKMVASALHDKWTTITPHFISNVDASQLLEEVKHLDPETTLFIVASKTFTTQETMTNAETAKAWYLKNGGSKEHIAKHFVAVSTNADAVKDFGIAEENMFIFWDWVGGRYSLWSAIGLGIACSAGYQAFEELLKGGHDMDQHFLHTEMDQNIPVIAALIGIWYNNFLNYESLAILPYDHRLRFLSSYLQQADMESNGKFVGRDGKKIGYQSGPIIWGEPGTNGQHAFYQLIHQGTKIIPTEFIAFVHPGHSHQDHHEKLLANFFAQPEALLNGKSEEQVREEMGASVDEKLVPFKVFEGNRPSTSILIKELTPFNLGKLIAYYEHKIFVQGVIWNIFSFDQWGVELGKQLAKPILSELQGGESGSHDPSTTALIKRFQELRK